MAEHRFSQDMLQKIRDSVSLVDIVRPAVPTLKRRGRADWWGCCPFHNEKSASFHVRDDEGYYHCFGCGAHGNAFDFVMETRGGNFMDAVRWLAAQAGVELPTLTEDPAARKRRTDGLAALARAAALYRRWVQEPARAYLARRGIDAATADTFALGYAPEGWSEISDALTAEGFTPDTLRAAGLTAEGKAGRGDYDRFRARLMFPIESVEGKVIGFGGRVIGEGEPKYLNSPETEFFNKRQVLYNLNRAREAIRSDKQALVVEGYMDVVGLWQQGVHNAVAPLGTALTEEQVKLLWRFHDTPVVCMDGDAAGRAAAQRTARRLLGALEPGRTVRFAWLPDGEDPDSFVAKHGKQAFMEVVGHTSSLDDVLWQSLTEGRTLTNADDRAAVAADIDNTVNLIKNTTVHTHYRRALRDKLWANVRSHNSYGGRGGKVQAGGMVAPTRVETSGAEARILLGILYRNPALMAQVGEKLGAMTFENQMDRDFQSILLRLWAAGGVDRPTLDTYLNDVGMTDTAHNRYTIDIVTEVAENNLLTCWHETCTIRTTAGEARRQQRRQAVDQFFNDAMTQDTWQQVQRLYAARRGQDDDAAS